MAIYFRYSEEPILSPEAQAVLEEELGKEVAQSFAFLAVDPPITAKEIKPLVEWLKEDGQEK